MAPLFWLANKSILSTKKSFWSTKKVIGRQDFSTGISALSKENPLKMSWFLKNKYFSIEKSPSYILIL
jgi:hypothetical protein